MCRHVTSSMNAFKEEVTWIVPAANDLLLTYLPLVKMYHSKHSCSAGQTGAEAQLHSVPHKSQHSWHDAKSDRQPLDNVLMLLMYSNSSGNHIHRSRSTAPLRLNVHKCIMSLTYLTCSRPNFTLPSRAKRWTEQGEIKQPRNVSMSNNGSYDRVLGIKHLRPPMPG